MINFDKIIHSHLERALEHNKENKSCHIAFLLQGRKIISHGYNQMERQCFRGKGITSLHAEIDCLRKCRPIKDLFKRNYTLLIVKISRDSSRDSNKYTDSRPCNCCTKFIQGLGFKSVYCSNEDGTIEKIKLDEYIPFKITYTLTKAQDKNGIKVNPVQQHRFI